jgi:hypothetical protein
MTKKFKRSVPISFTDVEQSGQESKPSTAMGSSEISPAGAPIARIDIN